MTDLKKGDPVTHRFRENYYQRCTILEIDGCNGLITVVCEDDFYKKNEKGTFCPQDLVKIN